MSQECKRCEGHACLLKTVPHDNLACDNERGDEANCKGPRGFLGAWAGKASLEAVEAWL